MSDVVNLRQARKAKKRDAAAFDAAVNRVAFGLRKVAKQQAKAEQARADQILDGAKRVH